MYDKVSSELPSYARISTHDATGNQYGNTLLIGDTYLHMICGYIEEKNISWCQIERSPMPAGNNKSEIINNFIFNPNRIQIATEFYLHSLDTFVYGTMGMYKHIRGLLLSKNESRLNLGMIGTSVYTEHNPLIIPVDVDAINNIKVNPKDVYITSDAKVIDGKHTFTLAQLKTNKKFNMTKQEQLTFTPQMKPLGALVQHTLGQNTTGILGQNTTRMIA